MSNIFDLFGTLDSTTTKNQSKCMTSESVKPRISDNGHLAIKNNLSTPAPKPKGLSVRQQVNSNICNTKLTEATDKNSFSKTLLKVPLNNSATLIPYTNKEKEIKAIHEKKCKGLSPANKSPHSKFSARKLPEGFLFKRPVTPRQIQEDSMDYPEPEILANYFDLEDFDRLSFDKISLGGGFRDWIISRKCVTPFEDDGIISDPEPLDVPPLSPPNFLSSESDSDEITSIPEIPLVSDDDDF